MVSLPVGSRHFYQQGSPVGGFAVQDSFVSMECALVFLVMV